LVIGGLTIATASAAPPAHGPWERSPTAEEVALLVLANKARVEHSSALVPYVWNDDLGEAARYHSWDLANHCQVIIHESCDNETFGARLARFYASSGVGENVGGGGDAQTMHNTFMHDSGHAGNILSSSFHEFGAGIDYSPTRSSYATQDFGARSVSIPTVPGAAVLLAPEWGTAAPTWNWPLLVNYYAGSGPRSVVAVVDGQPQTLARVAGTQTNGTWGGAYRTTGAPTTCKEVHFEVRRGDQTFRFPSSGDFGLGLTAGCWNRPVAIDTGSTPPPPPTAPVVTVQSPAAGSRVSGIVTIHATATDDGVVKKMEIWIDGRRAVAKAAALIMKNWNTKPKSVKIGVHTIVVKAFDNAGNKTELTVSVTK
jgi:hypothetical protein